MSCRALLCALCLSLTTTIHTGKESGDSAAEVFKDMGAQSGLEFQPIPCVDGQMDL